MPSAEKLIYDTLLPLSPKEALRFKELIDKTTSLEELRDALFEEYNHMDTKDLEELLVKAMIVAHLHGRSTGAER